LAGFYPQHGRECRHGRPHSSPWLTAASSSMASRALGLHLVLVGEQLLEADAPVRADHFVAELLRLQYFSRG
jgi:hypothetical protein